MRGGEGCDERGVLYVERGATEPTKQLGPYRRPALADLPGLAGHEQLRDVPLATIRDRLLFLLDDDLLVCGLAFLVEERPQRNRILGRPELPENHGGGAIGRVVLPERALRH